MPDTPSEVPSVQVPKGPVEDYLTWSTDQAQEAAKKSPEEHLDTAQKQAAHALTELKAAIEAGGLPKKGASLSPEAAEAQEHQIAAMKAGFATMEALIQAGQSGTVDILGRILAYDPEQGFHWQTVEELRAQEQ